MTCVEGAGFSDLKVISFEPKTFEDEDVEIAITHCGVCGSDLHSLKQGWGKAKLPLIVGHEIVGKIVRVGKNVTEFRLGQRVGMGPLVDSCQECRACKDGWENYCPERRWSYVSIIVTLVNHQPLFRIWHDDTEQRLNGLP